MLPCEIYSLHALTISTRKLRSNKRSIPEPLGEVVSVVGAGDGGRTTAIQTKRVVGSNGGDSEDGRDGGVDAAGFSLIDAVVLCFNITQLRHLV